MGNRSNIKEIKKMVSTANALTEDNLTESERKSLPKITLTFPACKRVDGSEAAFDLVAAATTLLVEAASRGWHAPKDSSMLSEELARWLVDVCDPKRECKVCKNCDHCKKLASGDENER